jgi:arylsulfatase
MTEPTTSDEATESPPARLSRRTVLKRSLLGAAAAGGLGAAPYVYRRLSGRASTWNKGQRVPTIVLITLDTTRADHLGCYGYPRPTSPNIDRLARESIVYQRMIATGTWTLPSHATLFTGKFTTSHGARTANDGNLVLSSAVAAPDGSSGQKMRSIATNQQTLAGLLRTIDYETCGVVGGPFLERYFGLDKGFSKYDDKGITNFNGRPAEEITDRALAWLRTPAKQPRFLFLNYFDPHPPLVPPDNFCNMLDPGLPDGPLRNAKAISLNTPDILTTEQLHGLYDAEIRYMDHHVGRLVDGLKELQLYNDSLMILTADHGELLREHGEEGHGDTPYQEVAHIPLIVKEPGGGRAGDKVDDWIQLTDILPMILDGVGVPLPADIQGEVPPRVRHPIIIESKTIRGYHKNGDWLSMIGNDGLKLISNTEGHHKLFDLNADPREEHNLINERMDTAHRMRTQMELYLDSLPEPGSTGPMQQADADTIKRLEALGYGGKSKSGESQPDGAEESESEDGEE